LSDRAEDIEAMMSMKVMEAEDLRKNFMQTAEAMVRTGMKQDDIMNRRAVTGRKDMKEMAEDVRKSFMRATEAVVKDMKGGGQRLYQQEGYGEDGYGEGRRYHRRNDEYEGKGRGGCVSEGSGGRKRQEDCSK